MPMMPATPSTAARSSIAAKSVTPSKQDSPTGTGPNLHGVVGRKIGSVKGFRYSKAMKKADFVWDEERLDAYLANPRKYLPKNRMSFPGLKKAKDRADVIAYLKSMSK